MQKIAIIFLFQPLLNLSENWSLVTCITNLGRIRENFPNWRAHKVKLLRKMRKALFTFHYLLVRELLISSMYNKFGDDT